MNSTWLRLFIFGVFFSLTTRGLAQIGRPTNPLIRALDRDRDGEISAKEIQNAPKNLKVLDTNKDGQIELSEIRRLMMQRDRDFGQRNRPAGNAAQQPSRSGRPGQRSDGNERLGGLEVGSELPDVTIYDADGKKMSTLDLRGKYAVLVFGCLT